VGTDWQDSKRRYLIHFADGGAGMQYDDRLLEAGDEIAESGEWYRIVRVEETDSTGGSATHARETEEVGARPATYPQRRDVERPAA
jgi:hypothetical protein